MRHVRRRGFTLIELLTVIAIIAVLAALLFPVFARVGENRRQATCISNMHKLYLAAHQYWLDNGEYPSMLFGYAENPDGTPWTGSGTPVEASNIKHGLLYKRYINDIEVFRCPDNPVKSLSAVLTPVYPPGVGFSGNAVFNTTDVRGFSFRGLPASYNGQAIGFYGIDSYDMTSVIGAPTQRQVGYTRDWTNVVGKNDASNQTKYAGKTMVEDKTLITTCNYHATVAGADKTIVLFATGTTKVLDARKVNQYGWTLAYAP